MPQKKKASVSEDVSSSIPTLEEATSESAPPSAAVESTVSVNEASMLNEGSSSVESEGSSGALNEGSARAHYKTPQQWHRILVKFTLGLSLPTSFVELCML